MQRLAVTGLLGLCCESALAHPSGAHAVQHALEHLTLALVFAAPVFLLIRGIRQYRRQPQRIHLRRRKP
jgi:hypothetical protein